MFPNLEAEQARFKISDESIAEKLKISKQTYLSKKRTGNFKVTEIRTLCKLYNCSFEYLFSHEPNTQEQINLQPTG